MSRPARSGAPAGVAPVQRLSAQRAGATLRIATVLFEGPRAHCAAHGCTSGTRVRLADRTGTHVLLDLPDGGSASVPLHWADFIAVDPLEPAN